MKKGVDARLSNKQMDTFETDACKNRFLSLCFVKIKSKNNMYLLEEREQILCHVLCLHM